MGCGVVYLVSFDERCLVVEVGRHHFSAGGAESLRRIARGVPCDGAHLPVGFEEGSDDGSALQARSSVDGDGFGHNCNKNAGLRWETWQSEATSF